MTVKRMDRVGIVVEDVDRAIDFFVELGLEFEGRAPSEGDSLAAGYAAKEGVRTLRSETLVDADDEQYATSLTRHYRRLVMKEIVALITQKTGISEQQAETAVETVVGFLKQKLPGPLASQLDSVIGGGGPNLGDLAGGLGGLFGKK